MSEIYRIKAFFFLKKIYFNFKMLKIVLPEQPCLSEC